MNERDKAVARLIEAVGKWRPLYIPGYGYSGERELAESYDALMAIPLEAATAAPVNRGAPLTAQQAAAWMDGERAASVAGRIVRLMFEDDRSMETGIMPQPYTRQGWTVDELERRLSGRHQTISARVHELARSGWVYPNGTRATRSGRMAEVYHLSAQAKEYLRGLS